ncbi:hypothetical protein TAMYLO_670232 [Tenacibaculum amylolyticum]
MRHISKKIIVVLLIIFGTQKQHKHITNNNLIKKHKKLRHQMGHQMRHQMRHMIRLSKIYFDTKKQSYF